MEESCLVDDLLAPGPGEGGEVVSEELSNSLLEDQEVVSEELGEEMFNSLSGHQVVREEIDKEVASEVLDKEVASEELVLMEDDEDPEDTELAENDNVKVVHQQLRKEEINFVVEEDLDFEPSSGDNSDEIVLEVNVEDKFDDSDDEFKSSVDSTAQGIGNIKSVDLTSPKDKIVLCESSKIKTISKKPSDGRESVLRRGDESCPSRPDRGGKGGFRSRGLGIRDIHQEHNLVHQGQAIQPQVGLWTQKNRHLAGYSHPPQCNNNLPVKNFSGQMIPYPGQTKHFPANSINYPGHNNNLYGQTLNLGPPLYTSSPPDPPQFPINRQRPQAPSTITRLSSQAPSTITRASPKAPSTISRPNPLTPSTSSRLSLPAPSNNPRPVLSTPHTSTSSSKSGHLQSGDSLSGLFAPSTGRPCNSEKVLTLKGVSSGKSSDIRSQTHSVRAVHKPSVGTVPRQADLPRQPELTGRAQRSIMSKLTSMSPAAQPSSGTRARPNPGSRAAVPSVPGVTVSQSISRFSAPPPPERSHFCSVCQVSLSNQQVVGHLRGADHIRRQVELGQLDSCLDLSTGPDSCLGPSPRPDSPGLELAPGAMLAWHLAAVPCPGRVGVISQRFNWPAQPVEESEEQGPSTPGRAGSPPASLSQRFGDLMGRQMGAVSLKRKAEQGEAACDVRKKIMEKLSGNRRKELLGSKVGHRELVDGQQGEDGQSQGGLGLEGDGHQSGDGQSQAGRVLGGDGHQSGDVLSQAGRGLGGDGQQSGEGQSQAGRGLGGDSHQCGDGLSQVRRGLGGDSQQSGEGHSEAGPKVIIIDSHSQTEEGSEDRIARRKARFGVVDQNFFDNEKYLVDRKASKVKEAEHFRQK